MPLEALQQEAALVRMMVCISLEEILPRPKAGLLSRMLRLADVNVGSSQSGHSPVYLLHPGAEYHIRVSLMHHPNGPKVPVQGLSWIRVGVADGQPVTLMLESDSGQRRNVMICVLHCVNIQRLCVLIVLKACVRHITAVPLVMIHQAL